MSSIWDDPDLATAEGEFVKFENIGDGVSGHITSIGKKTWDDGSISPQLGLIDDSGEPKTLTAGTVRLKALLSQHRPEVGDWINVHLTDVIKRPMGKTLKAYDDFELVRGGKKATSAVSAPAGKAVADDEPPF